MCNTITTFITPTSTITSSAIIERELEVLVPLITCKLHSTLKLHYITTTVTMTPTTYTCFTTQSAPTITTAANTTAVTCYTVCYSYYYHYFWYYNFYLCLLNCCMFFHVLVQIVNLS